MNEKEFKQRLAEMKPYENIFMRELFRDNIPLTELVFRIVTKKYDLKISSQISDFDPEKYSSKICLEAVGSDSSGQEYILILFSSYGILNYAPAGHFSTLIENGHKTKNGKPPIAYALYISDRNIIGSSDLIIQLDFADEDDKPFETGAHMLFLNCACRDMEHYMDIEHLAHDFSCANADDMFFDIMSDRAAHLKTEPDGIKYMYEIFERNGDNI